MRNQQTFYLPKLFVVNPLKFEVSHFILAFISLSTFTERLPKSLIGNREKNNQTFLDKYLKSSSIFS